MVLIKNEEYNTYFEFYKVFWIVWCFGSEWKLVNIFRFFVRTKNTCFYQNNTFQCFLDENFEWYKRWNNFFEVSDLRR